MSSDHIAAGEVSLEFNFHAPVERVWEALIADVGQWWPSSFYTSERTQRFYLEPKLGGVMGEDFGDGEGLVWYRVIGLDRPRSLMLSGYLLPPWAGPALSLVRIELTAVNAHETKMTFMDSTFGKMTDCSTAEGWQQIFGDHFTRHVAALA
ncbi:SRPBCC domain-containing protein [Synoicihabitans lomoniglobus]|uniref:SRPBCC domain-containing protein n=2 Tax=Synoicihabitans lomoniglobus TaxID=2909285 RepID=A0AAF0CNP3_9BACT|nr:SRPBCC domain-containing protein [Opitutaceae bacterium LMO-M01]